MTEKNIGFKIQNFTIWSVQFRTYSHVYFLCSSYFLTCTTKYIPFHHKCSTIKKHFSTGFREKPSNVIGQKSGIQCDSAFSDQFSSVFPERNLFVFLILSNIVGLRTPKVIKTSLLNWTKPRSLTDKICRAPRDEQNLSARI